MSLILRGQCPEKQGHQRSASGNSYRLPAVGTRQLLLDLPRRLPTATSYRVILHPGPAGSVQNRGNQLGGMNRSGLKPDGNFPFQPVENSPPPIRWWLTPTATSLSMDSRRRPGGAAGCERPRATDAPGSAREPSAAIPAPADRWKPREATSSSGVLGAEGKRCTGDKGGCPAGGARKHPRPAGVGSAWRQTEKQLPGSDR